MSLAGLLVLLGCASLLLGDSGTPPPAQPVTIAPAWLAPFSAASVQVDGDTLSVADLEAIDPKASGRDLAGRVLIGGKGEAELGLWVLHVGTAMERATPFLDQEGPGGSVGKPGDRAPAPRLFVPFRTPVPVTLTFLDAGGLPCRTRQLKVREIRLTDNRP
jgi:hypothetical protein